MCENLEILKELTSKLPPIPTLSEFKQESGGVTEYKFVTGTAISFPLFSTKDISIARTFISENTEFEKHRHPDSYEIIIVLEGCLELELNAGQKKTLQKHDKYIVETNKPHLAKALSDVWIIALTVPRDDGFPGK